MSTEVPVVGSTSSEQDTTKTQTPEEILEDNTEEITTEEETTEAESTTEEETPIEDDEVVDEEVKDEEVETEETLEEDAKLTQPSWKLIKEKFPELAKNKDFKNIFFQNQAFTELFPSVAEAKEAASKATSFEAINTSLINGNLEPILKNIDEETLVKFSDKILPALAEVNIKYFQRATRPLIIDVMNNVLEYADKTSDENLKKSIRNVSKFLTGNADIPARIKSPTEAPEVKEELDRLRSERQQLFQREEKKFLMSTDSIITKKIEQLVFEGLDPKKELSDFARKAVIKETMAELKEKINNDEGLLNKLQSIHKLAAKSGFADIYKSRVVSAMLDRARKLAPGIRAKHKSEALGKKSSKELSNTNGKIKASPETEEIKTTASKVTNVKSIDISKTSPMDYLNDKVTLRK